MRKNLVDTDMVECVIGIGKNLFYNSPMEACIVICRANKPADRRGKVLFINAKHEVTRKNAQSYLENSHIKKITEVYDNYAVEPGFSAVVSNKDILENGAELTISLYVDEVNDEEAIPVEDAVQIWLDKSSRFNAAYDKLEKLIKEGE